MPEIDLPDGLSDTTVIILVLLVCSTYILTRFKWFPNIFKRSNSNKLDQLMTWARNDKTSIDHLKQRADGNDGKWVEYTREHNNLEGKIDDTSRKIDNLTDMVMDMRLSSIRKDLFTEPKNKEEHEELIRKGDWYIEHSGNGIGKILLNNLKDDFKKRSISHDWDYTRKV